MGLLPINKSYAIGTKHNKIINQFYYYFYNSTMTRIIIAATLTLLLCLLTIHPPNLCTAHSDSEVHCIESERHALLNFTLQILLTALPLGLLHLTWIVVIGSVLSATTALVMSSNSISKPFILCMTSFQFMMKSNGKLNMKLIRGPDLVVR